jgi:hypothetical protein
MLSLPQFAICSGHMSIQLPDFNLSVMAAGIACSRYSIIVDGTFHDLCADNVLVMSHEEQAVARHSSLPRLENGGSTSLSQALVCHKRRERFLTMETLCEKSYESRYVAKA